MNPRPNLFPLSEAWMPPKLLVRDQQLEDLIKNTRCDYPYNFWIFGGRGLGKSLTVRIFKQVMDSEFSGEDVKVFIHSLTSRSVKEEAQRFCLSLGYRKPASELEADAIIKALRMAGVHDRVCIIFDDIDVMSRVMRGYFSYFIKALYDGLLNEGLAFSIHLISTMNPIQAESRILETTWSRLQPQPLVFPPYSRDEITLLLRQRLEFIDGLEWDEAALGMVAEEVAGLGGDFRQALRIAREVIAKHGKLTVDVVVDELISFRAQVWADLIRILPYKTALLLRAIVEETERRIRALEREVSEPEDLDGVVPFISWEDVKAAYDRLCEDYMVEREGDRILTYWLDEKLKGDWVESCILSKYDDANYKRKRGKFLRLKAPYSMMLRAMRLIDWETPW